MFLGERLLKRLHGIEFGALTLTLPNGKRHEFVGTHAGAHADLCIRDWRTIGRLLQRGDVGLAESYRDGWFESNDLTQLFVFGLQNEDALERCLYGGFLARIVARAQYFFRRNTLRGSKNNIPAHYDLGNDFYALWLDPSMTYSAALFAAADDDLTHAQQRKYDRILDRLHPSGSLLEIGCGWGGFAERALQTGDYTIKGLTLSPAQHAYANQRLNGAAQMTLQDYRHEQSCYNNIVSIEMFEAVGEAFWPVYFAKVRNCLAANGKAVVQTITICENRFERYRSSADAIRTFIFPGGMLPSLKRFEHAARHAGLTPTDSFAFGPDYARTLQHWLTRFNSNIDAVRAMGFDEKFVRMWRFYLHSCIAGFTTGRTDVMQIELQHAA